MRTIATLLLIATLACHNQDPPRSGGPSCDLLFDLEDRYMAGGAADERRLKSTRDRIEREGCDERRDD